jgi:hypothetical protein
MIDIKMSTVVLVLNQDGITELIQTANDLQNNIDKIMNSGQKQQQPRDRIADAGAAQTFLEVAKEKLPMILEEDNDEETRATSAAVTSKLGEFVKAFSLSLYGASKTLTTNSD